MKLQSSPRSQHGIVLLAVVVLLMVTAAAIMVSRATRISKADTADIARRLQLNDWLAELKSALVVRALREDNTPGTMPCPGGSASCDNSADDLAGAALSASSLDLPNGVPAGACVQYVLAPSLRNSLNTNSRGLTQNPINLAFDSDLTFIDSAGNTTKAWAVLLGHTSNNNPCTLDGLGYALTVTSGLAQLRPSNNKSLATSTLPLVSQDFLAGLFTQILEDVDTVALVSHLQSAPVAGISSAPLSSARLANAQSFDAAIAPVGTTLSPGAGPDCNGIAASASSPIVYKTPVAWLCFNAWHEYITFDPSTSEFEISTRNRPTLPTSTPLLGCKRRNGSTSCA